MLIRRAKTSECAALLRGAYGRRPGVGFGRRGGFRGFGGGAPPLLNLATGGTFTRGSEASCWSAPGVMSWASSNIRRITNAAYYGAATGGTGVVLEGSATNLCLQSEDFTTTWSNSGLTITSDTTAAPDGDVDADTLNDPGIGFNEVRQTISVSTSTDYTVSLFIKKDTDETRFPEIGMYTTGAGVIGSVQLNTKTGATATRGSPVGSGVESRGDWWRLWVSANTGAQSSVLYRVLPAVTDTLGSTETSASGSIIAVGAQFEARLFPSSYTRTTTGTVTRSADDLTFASIPVRMREGKWKMVYWPLESNADSSAERRILDDSVANNDYLRFRGSDLFELVDGNTSRFTAAKTWSRLNRIEHVVDMQGLTITSAGFDMGDGDDTGAASAWADNAFRVGGAHSGTSELAAIYANPVAA